MRIFPWLLVLGLLLASTTRAVAEYQYTNVSQSPVDSYCPAVACSPGGAIVVAWQEHGGGVRTRRCDGETWFAPVYQGAGSEPSLCYGLGEFHLAFANGSVITVRRSLDGIAWTPPQQIDSGQAGEVFSPSISTSWTEGTWPEVYLVWAEADHRQVWFSDKVDGIWRPPQRVAELDEMLGYPQPIVRVVQGAGPPMPRVYYLDGFHLQSVERTPGGWNPPFQVLDYAGSDFDVAAAPFGYHRVLSLEPQVPCPCNRISYSEETEPGQWSSPVDLTIDLAAYDYPQSPALVVDGEHGMVHALWFQEFFDDDLQPAGQRLYYKTWNGALWCDRSPLLDGHAGGWTDVTLDDTGDAVLVWSERSASQLDVWSAWNRGASAVADAAWPVRSALDVYPNPFRDRTTIVYESAGEPIVLDVIDAGGRQVARLEDGSQAPGRHRLGWDGRGIGGAAVPAGAYFVRLRSGRTFSTGVVRRIR